MKEKIIEKILLVIALSSIFTLALITFFIFEEGLPLILKIGPKAFLFGEEWIPSKGLFGIFPMIVSSFWVTFGALLLGIPLGLACPLSAHPHAGHHQCQGQCDQYPHPKMFHQHTSSQWLL